MKPIIHVETPDGNVLKTTTGSNSDEAMSKEHTETNDANDNAAGPKSNPDPRANENLGDKNEMNPDEGTGTEITDGEAG